MGGKILREMAGSAFSISSYQDKVLLKNDTGVNISYTDK